MKKLLFFLVLLLIIPIVHAKEFLGHELDWQTYQEQGVLGEHLEYKDGYILIDYDMALRCHIRYYDIRGNLKQEMTLNDIVAYTFVEEYIYVLSIEVENNYSTYILTAYNDKFEKLNDTILYRRIIDDGSPLFSNSEERIMKWVKENYDNSLAMTLMLFQDGYFYTIGMKEGLTSVTGRENEFDLRKYKKDLSSFDVIEINSEEDLIEVFGDNVPVGNNEIIDRYYFEDKYNIVSPEYVISYDYSDNVVILGTEEYTSTNTSKYRIRIYYNDQLVTTKEVEGMPFEAKLIDDYAAVVFSGVERRIEFYNPKTGELVNTLNSEETIYGLKDTKKGFIYNETNCNYFLLQQANHLGNNLNPTLLFQPAHCHTNRNIYHVFNRVTTKITSGKGRVIVDEKQYPDELVHFEVIADKGYELDKVKVTDADGHVLIFKEYTFTMPSADVVIEAVFKIKNPETKDLAITTVILITIVTGGLYLIYRKKMKEIN